MNEEKFGSRELLRLKYRREDQIIQTCCKIGYPQKLGPPYLIYIDIRAPRKVLLIHADMIKL